MNDIMRVSAAAIVAAVCAMVVRKQVPEIGLLLAACGGVLILLYCSGAIKSAVVFAERLAETGGLSPAVLKPVMKVTGISVIARLAAELCRDAKEGALASAVETAGAAMALLAVLPLMSAALELLTNMM